MYLILCLLLVWSDCFSKVPSPLSTVRVADIFYCSLHLNVNEIYKESQPKAERTVAKISSEFENSNTEPEPKQVFCPDNRKAFPEL